MQPSELFESLLSAAWGFATFEHFVSPSLLIGCYYLGALAAPVIAVYLVRRMLRRYSPAITVEVEVAGSDLLDWLRTPRGLKLAAVLMLILFELGWRIMFELILAYFQMRDALVGLSTPGT